MHHPTDRIAHTTAFVTPVVNISNEIETSLKRTLFNETRQYNIQIFDISIFLKYRTKQIKATETNK